MSKTKQYSPEVKERAVRLVQEARKDYPSLWAAVESIAPKIGCAGATLYEWVKRHEIDSGLRDGMMAGRTEVEAVEKPVFKRKSDNRVAQRRPAPFFIFMPFSRSTGNVSDVSWRGGLV